jgi:hypothetical protein
VAGGHRTETPVDSVYSGVVTLAGVRTVVFEQCQSMSASPVTFLVLNLRAYYYRVDQSKERTEYMCVTAGE